MLLVVHALGLGTGVAPKVETRFVPLQSLDSGQMVGVVHPLPCCGQAPLPVWEVLDLGSVSVPPDWINWAQWEPQARLPAVKVKEARML